MPTIRLILTAIFAGFLAALLMVSTKAEGAEIGAHMGSIHFPQNDNNNFNPGLYYRSDEGWTGGFYYNSERRMSVYAGRTFTYSVHDWKFSATVGGVTGYQRAAVLPMLVPSIATPPIGGERLRVAYIPRIEKDGAGVLHFMLERNF